MTLVDPRELDDAERAVLRDLLRCSQCGQELTAAACGPTHAVAANRPEWHNDALPALITEIERLRTENADLRKAAIESGFARVLREHAETMERLKDR